MVNNKINGKAGVFDGIVVVLLTIATLSMLYPLLNLIFISFSSMDEVVKSNSLMLYPKSINLEGYAYVLQYAGLTSAYKVTIYITVVGTLINLILTSLGAYVLSNKELPGRNQLTMVVLVTMFFSGGMIPSYLVVKNLNLVNTLWALMIPGAINTFWLILQRNFFQAIPPSLRESARIDGCSEVKILIQIILPLSTPILATLTLFYGVTHWNHYSNAIIYITNPKLMPLQVIIRQMYTRAVDQISAESMPPPVETVKSATVVLATLPIICLYPFLQKYFVQGVMVGSVKG